jgi:hypothetical protein
MATRLWLTLASVTLTLCAAYARPERNAFLNRAVRTHAQLMHQVKTDWAVRDRYMRHFGMGSTQVLAYFSELRLARLKDDTGVIMYNVPDSGVLRSRFFVLKRGTKVFVDRSGEPILKLSCGNPLTRGPRVVTTIPGPEPEAPAVAVEELKEVVVEAQQQPQVLAEAPAAIEMPEMPEMAITRPVATPHEFVPKPLPPVEKVEPIPYKVGARIPPFWLFLPPIAFALPKQHNDEPPIPEPATVLILGAGIAGFVGSRAKRRRRR